MAPCQRDLPYREPSEAAACFSDETVLCLLDSGGPADLRSRYSYLCVHPTHVIQAYGSTVLLDGAPVAAAVLDVLETLLSRYLIARDPDGLPFQGGAVGYIGYEAGAGLEDIAASPRRPDDPPDVFLAFFDLVIGFDRVKRSCRVVGATDARLDWATAQLARLPPPADAPLPILSWQPDFAPDAYAAKVSLVLEYIRAGDVFQANFTQRHVAPRPPSLAPGQVYRALRQVNPAPFGAWLHGPGFDLCCSSPERFVRLQADGRLETRPIKGTIARGATPDADRDAQVHLAASAKDRAENVMIVDVLRNDIGRVSTIGSVTVPALCAVESFATVHHLVSSVEARLRPGLGPVDVLRAVLPGGSITGAPKIRAMQIIAELEAGRRGIYCGSVVWIGHDGAMDSNIVIRSLVLTPERVIAQAGGGIVADSDPAAEYAEMQLKLAPMTGIFA